MKYCPPPIPVRTALPRRKVATDSQAAEWSALDLLEGLEQSCAEMIPGLFLVRAECRQHHGTETATAPSHEQQRQKSMNSIGWLSTCIVHDLKNPLTTVFASAEMLLDLDQASPQAKRLAANIYKAARSMRDLLASVADKSVANKSAIEICRVQDVIFAASRAARSTCEAPLVEMRLEVAEELQIAVQRARMEKVFFNLIINALEAMPDGGVISVRARKVNNHVLIEVEDSGPGIPRAIRDRLFEPFATAGKAHGLGLGLALSRQVVLEQGGDMWIEPAIGARFVTSLPLHFTEMK